MTLLNLFLTFFKIGLFTFGGGYAMLPLIEEEVTAHGWLTTQQLVNFVAVSESTPGPFAINISTYVGAETAGFFGALVAMFGVVLPSFIVILIVAKCYVAFKSSAPVQGALSGLRPAVVGLIGAAAVSVGAAVFFPSGVSAAEFTNPQIYVSLGILAFSLLLLQKKLHPILLILVGAALGLVSGFFIFPN